MSLLSPRRVPFDPARYRPRSWAHKHHVAIELALLCAGIAVLEIVQGYNLEGRFAAGLRLFSGFALILSPFFTWNSGPIFPPSPVNDTNRRKYLLVLAFLWLVVLPAAWFAAHAYRK
jgi:hypothetical protein